MHSRQYLEVLSYTQCVCLQFLSGISLWVADEEKFSRYRGK